MIVLVDDMRSFREGREAVVVRSSRAALELLESLRGEHIEQLWLDHDLGKPDGVLDSVLPVVSELERAAVWGEPYSIGEVLVHSSNPSGAASVLAALSRQGYRARRVPAELELHHA